MVASVSGQDTLQQEYDRLVQELAREAKAQLDGAADASKLDLQRWLDERDEQPHHELTGFILMNSSTTSTDVYTSGSSAEYARSLLAKDILSRL